MMPDIACKHTLIGGHPISVDIVHGCNSPRYHEAALDRKEVIHTAGAIA